MLQTIDQSLDPTYEDLELISPSYLWANRSRPAAPPSARITTIASNRERDTRPAWAFPSAYPGSRSRSVGQPDEIRPFMLSETLRAQPVSRKAPLLLG